RVMSASSCSLGNTPASESAVALTITRKRIDITPYIHSSNGRRRDRHEVVLLFCREECGNIRSAMSEATATDEEAKELERAADELYGMRPEEFSGARDAAVKQARADGRPGLA